MNHIARVRVSLEAGLELVVGTTPDEAREAFADLADGLMEALIADDEVVDPFVFGNAAEPTMILEVTVEAHSVSEALATAAKHVDAAFEVAGLEATSATANVLTPA